MPNDFQVNISKIKVTYAYRLKKVNITVTEMKKLVSAKELKFGWKICADIVCVGS